MKKKILTVLSLVLVLAAVVVVCTACSGKEEAKEETAKMNLTFVNQTGETVTKITVKERSGSKNQVWQSENIAADSEATVGIDTVVKDGAPDLELEFVTESSQTFATLIDTKGDKTIVMKADPEGGFVADITTK